MAKIHYNTDTPASVAHEGNPRTDDLVVTGTLDGTVTLTFAPLYSLPDIPNPPLGYDQGLLSTATGCNCDVQTIRFPSVNCDDFIRDCYDIGSATINAPLTGSLNACSGQNTGCCSGNLGRNITPSELVVRSSDNGPMGGYSLWFGNAGPIVGIKKVVYACEGALLIRAINSGSPILGAAFNVSPQSTARCFTGQCIVANFNTNEWQVLNYVNQSLKDGSPTVITSAPMGAFPSGGIYLNFWNYPPSTNEFHAAAYDFDTFDNLFFYQTTAMPSNHDGIHIGAGYVWIGNLNIGGLHEGVLAQSLVSPVSYFTFGN